MKLFLRLNFILFVSAIIFVNQSRISIAEFIQSSLSQIHVTGTGEVYAEPDMVIVSFAIIHEASSASKALGSSNKTAANVIGAMKALGVMEKDMQTIGFDIEPKFYYPKNSNDGRQFLPNIIGYTVSNSLNVQVYDLNNLGQILDQIVKLGVNSGLQLHFTNRTPSPFIDEARRRAVEDAIKQAKLLASSSGVSLGKILEIKEHPNQEYQHSQQVLGFSVSSKIAMDSVPVQTGRNIYKASVNISWQLIN